MPAVIRSSRWPLLALGLIGLSVAPAAPARAGLLAPLLSLARPQLEASLAQQCVRYSAAGDAQLQVLMNRPCQALARPIAACLLNQTEASGRTLGVISELIAGHFGDDSEVVVQRCLAITFGLPTDTFARVPLRRLAEAQAVRLGSISNPAQPPAAGCAPAVGVPPRLPESATTVQPLKPTPP
ncbi:MAG: hypothetical protein RLZZ624_125 [Cyanobacteriota bacterium]